MEFDYYNLLILFLTLYHYKISVIFRYYFQQNIYKFVSSIVVIMCKSNCTLSLYKWQT